jgi:hypothetical protein
MSSDLTFIYELSEATAAVFDHTLAYLAPGTSAPHCDDGCWDEVAWLESDLREAKSDDRWCEADTSDGLPTLPWAKSHFTKEEEDEAPVVVASWAARGPLPSEPADGFRMVRRRRSPDEVGSLSTASSRLGVCARNAARGSSQHSGQF